MREIECPECGEIVEIESESLPETAAESIEIQCEHCGHEFMIGWYAELEYR